MRWALMGSFEHSNQELLALSICRDMTVFVIPGGRRASLGGPWDVPVGPRGVLGGSQGRPWGSQGRARGSQERPWGSQGRAQGIPGIPWSSGDVPGIPGILFIKKTL